MAYSLIQQPEWSFKKNGKFQHIIFCATPSFVSSKMSPQYFSFSVILPFAYYVVTLLQRDWFLSLPQTYRAQFHLRAFTLFSVSFASPPRYLPVSLWLPSSFLFKCHSFREVLLDCALKGVPFPKFPIPFFTFSAALPPSLLTCVQAGASLTARAEL